MTNFWERKNVPKEAMTPEQPEMVLNEEAIAEIQGDPNLDLSFEDDEEDTAFLMADANLRLEQGRLYQMVLENNIFGETNADPRAIKNVQREIRKFVRERLETMLGIRQEVAIREAIVSSPFNDLEVTALKMLASKISNGATEQAPKVSAPTPAVPKKDGITAISGNLRTKEPTPLRKEAKAPIKSQPKKAPAKSAIKEEESYLAKPIEEMTPEELAKHDADALERRSRNYAALPNNLVPHPSPQQLEMMYSQQAIQNPAPGSAVARMTDLINGRNN